MKKVMLFALMGMFSLAMFAQTQEKAKPAEKKAEPVKTETAKPAASAPSTSNKPATKEEAKPVKHKSKDAAKPAEKKAETPKK